MSSLFTDWMEGIGVELMLFGAAWLVWGLATRHLQHFFDLRLRIRRHIERMADADAPQRGAAASDATSERTPAKAAEVTGALGFELLSLAQRAPLSARVAKLMGYDPVRAGDQLVSLSRDGQLVFHCRLVGEALRLREDAPEAQ